MKNISLGDFEKSLASHEPPAGLSLTATALWWAGKAEWNKAHTIVQDLSDSHAEHIHGFLHRQEGDLSNARYWYSRAGANFPKISLEEEWKELVRKSL